MPDPQMVWHYTASRFAGEIEEHGELQPTNRQGNYLCSLLWFTAFQEWEYMTAMLGDLNVLYGHKARPWQQLALEHRAVRYGLPISDPRLLDWKATCIAGGINRQDRKAREKVAKKNRSDANKWYTTTEPIPLADLRYQVWFQGEWGECCSIAA